jgi:peptidoglycan/LPS O-acetylase OafA/YrhL
MFLRYVHGFRAVAIVVIVAGHAVFTLTWPTTSPTRDVLLDLLDGGTVLFVFVAGFLFHHLSGRFAYRDYLTKKLQYVIVPYVLVSIPAIVVTLRFTDLPARFPELAGTPAAYQALWLLAKGGATFNYPLWFVPMIALFYLAAPLFMLFVRHPRLYLVLLVLTPYSLLAHRTDELDTPTIALYFLPAYLAGMWASEHRARLEPVLDRFWGALCGAWLAAVGAMLLLLDHHGNYYGIAPFSQEHGPVDWMFAQKLLLCFALLALMRRLDGVVGDRLRALGDASFTIFFVHGYALVAFQVGWRGLTGSPPPGDAGLALGLAAVVVVATLAGTLLAKRLLGRRSRYLIGS